MKGVEKACFDFIRVWIVHESADNAPAKTLPSWNILVFQHFNRCNNPGFPLFYDETRWESNTRIELTWVAVCLPHFSPSYSWSVIKLWNLKPLPSHISYLQPKRVCGVLVPHNRTHCNIALYVCMSAQIHFYPVVLDHWKIWGRF